ncbi:hypothetical protein ACIGB8_27715 [Promicromonospora sukumoe]|uniref:hypothetical protein n=1 Tax=Promicromonospora sukumoe TaxID=88382 RepID=UPI0037CC96C0
MMGNTTVEIVSDYLNEVERLLQHADGPSVAVLAPAELERTVEVIRALLADHHLDALGRCRRCTSRWAWWRRAVPCREWKIAYERAIAALTAHPTGPILAVGGPR